MKISTERCTIRRFMENDIDDFIRYRNDGQWMRYQGFKGMTKEAYAKELLSNNSLAHGIQFAIVNNATLTLIGDIYLKQENDTFWIGYTINPLYARQGYVYEVISEVISWIKQQGCVCVKAGVLPDNIASINLLNKLKFSYAGMDDCGEQIYTLHLQNK